MSIHTLGDFEGLILTLPTVPKHTFEKRRVNIRSSYPERNDMPLYQIQPRNIFPGLNLQGRKEELLEAYRFLLISHIGHITMGECLSFLRSNSPYQMSERAHRELANLTERIMESNEISPYNTVSHYMLTLPKEVLGKRSHATYILRFLSNLKNN